MLVYFYRRKCAQKKFLNKKGELIKMKAKKFFALVMALVLVLGLNATSVFATEGVWTIDGLENNGDTSTNNVSWTSSDTADEGNSWSFWSQDGSDDGAWISQTVTLEAGTYTLSFIHNGQDSGGSVTFYGYIGDNVGVTDSTTAWQAQTKDGQASWGTYSEEITVDAGTYEVGIYAYTTVANCWAQFDNISLTDSAGNEYLTLGDLDCDDSEWATYFVNNADVTSSEGDDETTTSSSSSNTNSTTAASGSSSSSSSSSSTAAKTGDNTPIAMAAIAIIAAAAVVVARKKRVND